MEDRICAHKKCKHQAKRTVLYCKKHIPKNLNGFFKHIYTKGVQKAMTDAIVFGTGMVKVTDNGQFYHQPLIEVFCAAPGRSAIITSLKEDE